jgi:hypothetical protein
MNDNNRIAVHERATMPSIAAPNDKFGSLPGYSPKLEFKYFLIQLFHVTAIVLIPDMYGC